MPQSTDCTTFKLSNSEISLLDIQLKTRCVCETLMPPKYTSLEKHDPDV